MPVTTRRFSPTVLFLLCACGRTALVDHPPGTDNTSDDPNNDPPDEVQTIQDPCRDARAALVYATTDGGQERALQGAVVSGRVYMAVRECEPLAEARLWLDFARSSERFVTLSTAPFAYEQPSGGLNSTYYQDGSHHMSVDVQTVSDETVQLDVDFTIDNGLATHFEYAITDDRVGLERIEGASVPASIYIALLPGPSNVVSAALRIDGTIINTEVAAPFDLRGTDGKVGIVKSPRAYTFSTPGPHTVSADITLAGGSTSTVTNSFTIPAD